MSRRYFGVLLIAAAMFTLGMWLASSPRLVEAQPKAKHSQWEYKIVKIPGAGKDLSDEMNKLGADGWEYADLFGTSDYLFMREKR